jgi:hypothetical protein
MVHKSGIDFSTMEQRVMSNEHDDSELFVVCHSGSVALVKISEGTKKS